MTRISMLFSVLIVAMTACRDSHEPQPGAGPSGGRHAHVHEPPHGGTLVVLGEEQHHLELVLDATNGRIQAFIFDGHLDNFVRIPAKSFEIAVNGQADPLVFNAATNTATGETVGNTALFVAQADWLKTQATFDGNLKSLEIRGVRYEGISFNFPKGNEVGK